MTCHKITLTIAALATIAPSYVAASDNIVKEITPYTTSHTVNPKPMEFVDGSTYVQLSDDGRTIDLFEVASGKKTETILDLGHTRETTLASIDGFIFSPDRSKIIIWYDAQRIYRRSFAARYYIYDVRTRQLRPLANDFEYVQSPVFSADARMIAFVYENNIYLKKLDFNTKVAVTTDGKKGSILNGVTDWTYEEEFSTVCTMAFSPDNTSLCYVKSNETDVPTYNLPIYAGACNREEQYALYPGLFTYKYPVAGEKNSTVSLHSYEISNRNTKDITLPDKQIEYIPRIDFAPVGDQLLVTTLNRDQNRMEIYSVNPKTTLATSVLVEKSEAWILPATYEDMKVVNDGFVIQSARTGWNHLYKYAFNGTLSHTLTSGEFDVTAFYGIDAAGTVYYQAARPTAIDRTVYRVDIKGVTSAISAESGDSSAKFSPDCKAALLSYSDVSTPPVYSIINERGRQVRTLVDNASVKNEFAALPAKEFIKIPGGDGVELNAYIIRPDNFDPARKYPVVMYQYSGPGSQSVLNRWSISWEHYFAKKGFVIVCADGRGTGGRGTSFMYPVYRKLGYYETIDQVAVARWLGTQSWVDASRIGIHGWSYGGYETLMCLQTDNSPFAAGAAVAPVTDWRLYDTVYAERYMLTPQQNFDGYRTSAPLNFTDKMRSQLLLMTGTADDNVHPANTFEYASNLQFNGTLFDMMVFPNKNHSIYGCNARAVVYGNMYRFFNNNLMQK